VLEVVSLDREPQRVHEPGHPLADEEGFVYVASVDTNEEMVDMLEASRQYQNNLEVVTTLRTLMMRTVDMGKS
jgi:flagellar basal-body rod protein FlgC